MTSSTAASKPLTLSQVKQRINGLPGEEKRAVVCALVGHSRIVSMCFGYVSCGRCQAQIADRLMGVYSEASSCVVINHSCKTCRTNFNKMGWQDKFLSPNPFTKHNE